jgi:hypothetical protein
MARSISVGRQNARVTGIKELDKKMQEIAPKMQQRIFKSAIKPSLEKMESAAKENVMRLSVSEPEGLARKGIASKIGIRMIGRKGSKYSTIGRLAVFYGRSATQRAKFLRSPVEKATLAHLFEFGFRLTHWFGIPRSKLGLASKRIGPRPFMTPAFEDNKDEAEDTFLRVIALAVEEQGK